MCRNVYLRFCHLLWQKIYSLPNYFSMIKVVKIHLLHIQQKLILQSWKITELYRTLSFKMHPKLKQYMQISMWHQCCLIWYFLARVCIAKASQTAVNDFGAKKCSRLNIHFVHEFTMFTPAKLLSNWWQQQPGWHWLECHKTSWENSF